MAKGPTVAVSVSSCKKVVSFIVKMIAVKEKEKKDDFASDVRYCVNASIARVRSQKKKSSVVEHYRYVWGSRRSL